MKGRGLGTLLREWDRIVNILIPHTIYQFFLLLQPVLKIFHFSFPFLHPALKISLFPVQGSYCFAKGNKLLLMLCILCM